MQLKPGLRLHSAVCRTELVVVKGQGDVDVRCGGAPMLPKGAGEPAGQPIDPGFAQGTLMGKRYGSADGSIELLCTKPGDGSLSIGTTMLETSASKPLPASD